MLPVFFGTKAALPSATPDLKFGFSLNFVIVNGEPLSTVYQAMFWF